MRDGGAALARSYNVTGTPIVVFIDRTGAVRYIGNELPADYAARLDALLSE